MQQASTSLRDPIFYEYHRLFDEFYKGYQNKRPSYSPSAGVRPPPLLPKEISY
jgi:hypothetical protein